MSITKLFKHRYIIFSVSVFALLIISIGLLSILKIERVSLPEKTSYSITGNFAADGSFPPNDSLATDIKSHNKNLILWGSWTGDDKHTGKLVSPAFKAPSILTLFVTGYPNLPGNELFLEQIDTKDKLKLKTGNPGEKWINTKWILPDKWRGSMIRLVAIDNATVVTGWLGVSSPIENNWFSLLGYQMLSLVILPLYIIHFLLFLLPGLFLAILIVQNQKLTSSFTLILGITISSFIGYATFWLYFLNHTIGQIVSSVILLTAVGCLVRLYQKKTFIQSIKSVDLLFPLLIMFVTGLFYVSVLYAWPLGELPEILAQVRFFGYSFPPDNIIPKLFADKLYVGSDPRHLIGDWLSSDRPPLQSGLMLVQRPFMDLTRLELGLHYQLLATIIQCSWVPAMWALCRTVNLSGQRIALVMGFSIFSGFFLFNSVFVWPKLIAGALTIFAFTLILQSIRTSQVLSTIEVILAAAAAALGMMAHGGVIFTLPAIALITLWRRYFPGFRRVLIGCTIFALLLAPWTAYQKFYEPPGNRLVKWHLGGVVNVDNRPALRTIIDSYSSLTVPQIINNKWENVKVLLGNVSSFTTDHETRRVVEFSWILKGLGILNIGWLILIPILLVKRLRSLLEIKLIMVSFGVSLISLIFWILVMFGPATTVIHHGSYATMILLFTGLAALIARLPAFLSYFLLAFQIVVFAVTWILTTPLTPPNTLIVAPNIFVILLIVATSVSLAKVLARLSQEQLLSP